MTIITEPGELRLLASCLAAGTEASSVAWGPQGSNRNPKPFSETESVLTFRRKQIYGSVLLERSKAASR